MPRFIEGNLTAAGLKVGIVVARFNNLITERLLEGAIDTVVRHGGDAENITVVRVPGAFELPAAAARMLKKLDLDALICIAAVIRGGTPHFEYVSAEVSKGVAQLAMSSGIPVSFGVLTTDSIEQAIERAGSKAGNKGAEAALAAIELAQVFKQL